MARLLLALTVAIALGGCAPAEDDPGIDEGAEVEEAERDEPDEPTDEAASEFAASEVHVELELDAPFSRIEVHFVTEGDVVAAAEGCLDHYLERYESVFCYGFASQEDFEFANVQEEGGGGMERLCWTARAEKANPDADPGIYSGGPTDPDCPSA